MINMIKRKGCIKTRSTPASFASVTVKWTIRFGYNVKPEIVTSSLHCKQLCAEIQKIRGLR